MLGVAFYQIGYTEPVCGGNYRPACTRRHEAGALIRPCPTGPAGADRLTRSAPLGADGVVRRARAGPFPDLPTAVEFHAIGTAVRADGDVRPDHAFLRS